MSLRSLLRWHYFTVQSNEGAGQSDTGAIFRKDGNVDIDNATNIRGHLQNVLAGSGKGRDDRITDFGKSEIQTFWVLFHNHLILAKLDTRNRVLININPRRPISVSYQERIDNKDQIRIFKVISNRDPIAKRGFTLFELYLELTTRESI